MTHFPERRRPAPVPISRLEFLEFREFFLRKIGMDFSEDKRYFVDPRLAERTRATGCATIRDYLTLLRFEPHGVELEQLTNGLTVNETYFFRETDQFTALVEVVLPEIATQKTADEPIRIWSLPCSTGEEPYSIAISVLEHWARSDEFAIQIVGSDIDTRVLASAADGLYNERSLQNVSADIRARYFTPRRGVGYQLIKELRESIDFTRTNLSDPTDMANFRNFDVIFCRNLLIYFDESARREAVGSIFEALNPGGFLFLGHSESMSRMSSLFTPRKVGECFAYQRPPQRCSAAPRA